MTNYNIMNKEEKRKAIDHKYEYELKQQFFRDWSLRAYIGTEKAIERMKTTFELLKKHNPNSEYIEKLEKFIKNL